LFAVACDWVPAQIATVIPVAPWSRIVRQVLPRDIAQRLEYPTAGRRIERRIFCEIEQLRNGGAPLLFTQHPRLRQTASSTFTDVRRWIVVKYVQQGLDNIVRPEV